MLRASIGNGEAKELISMTYGQEQRRGDCQRDWGVLDGGGHGGKTVGQV